MEEGTNPRDLRAALDALRVLQEQIDNDAMAAALMGVLQVQAYLLHALAAEGLLPIGLAGTLIETATAALPGGSANPAAQATLRLAAALLRLSDSKLN